MSQQNLTPYDRVSHLEEQYVAFSNVYTKIRLSIQAFYAFHFPEPVPITGQARVLTERRQMPNIDMTFALISFQCLGNASVNTTDCIYESFAQYMFKEYEAYRWIDPYGNDDDDSQEFLEPRTEFPSAPGIRRFDCLRNTATTLFFNDDCCVDNGDCRGKYLFDVIQIWDKISDHLEEHCAAQGVEWGGYATELRRRGIEQYVSDSTWCGPMGLRPTEFRFAPSKMRCVCPEAFPFSLSHYTLPFLRQQMWPPLHRSRPEDNGRRPHFTHYKSSPVMKQTVEQIKEHAADGVLVRALPFALTFFLHPSEAVWNAWNAVRYTNPSYEAQDAVDLYVYLICEIMYSVSEQGQKQGKKRPSKADVLYKVATQPFRSWAVSNLFYGALERRVYGIEYQDRLVHSPLITNSEDDVLGYEKMYGSAALTLFTVLWTFFRTESLQAGKELLDRIRSREPRAVNRNVYSVYAGLAACWYGDYAPVLFPYRSVRSSTIHAKSLRKRKCIGAERGTYSVQNIEKIETPSNGAYRVAFPEQSGETCNSVISELEKKDKFEAYWYGEWGVSVYERCYRNHPYLGKEPENREQGHGWHVTSLYDGKPFQYPQKRKRLGHCSSKRKRRRLSSSSSRGFGTSPPSSSSSPPPCPTDSPSPRSSPSLSPSPPSFLQSMHFPPQMESQVPEIQQSKQYSWFTGFALPLPAREAFDLVDNSACVSVERNDGSVISGRSVLQAKVGMFETFLMENFPRATPSSILSIPRPLMGGVEALETLEEVPRSPQEDTPRSPLEGVPSLLPVETPRSPVEESTCQPPETPKSPLEEKPLYPDLNVSFTNESPRSPPMEVDELSAHDSEASSEEGASDEDEDDDGGDNDESGFDQELYNSLISYYYDDSYMAPQNDYEHDWLYGDTDSDTDTEYDTEDEKKPAHYYDDELIKHEQDHYDDDERNAKLKSWTRRREQAIAEETEQDKQRQIAMHKDHYIRLQQIHERENPDVYYDESNPPEDEREWPIPLHSLNPEPMCGPRAKEYWESEMAPEVESDDSNDDDDDDGELSRQARREAHDSPSPSLQSDVKALRPRRQPLAVGLFTTLQEEHKRLEEDDHDTLYNSERQPSSEKDVPEQPTLRLRGGDFHTSQALTNKDSRKSQPTLSPNLNPTHFPKPEKEERKKHNRQLTKKQQRYVKSLPNLWKKLGVKKQPKKMEIFWWTKWANEEEPKVFDFSRFKKDAIHEKDANDPLVNHESESLGGVGSIDPLLFPSDNAEEETIEIPKQPLEHENGKKSSKEQASTDQLRNPVESNTKRKSHSFKAPPPPIAHKTSESAVDRKSTTNASDDSPALGPDASPRTTPTGPYSTITSHFYSDLGYGIDSDLFADPFRPRRNSSSSSSSDHNVDDTPEILRTARQYHPWLNPDINDVLYYRHPSKVDELNNVQRPEVYKQRRADLWEKCRKEEGLQGHTKSDPPEKEEYEEVGTPVNSWSEDD